MSIKRLGHIINLLKANGIEVELITLERAMEEYRGLVGGNN